MAYNWTLLGTYGAVKKLFVNDNEENGLGGRILFSMMPSRNFEEMPTYKERDEHLDGLAEADGAAGIGEMQARGCENEALRALLLTMVRFAN